jgi:hypothetical protein
MSRRTSQWFAIVVLSLAAFTTACDRADSTGPSEIPSPAFSEGQGSNN